MKNNFLTFLLTFLLFSPSFLFAQELAEEAREAIPDKIDPSNFFNLATIQILNKTTAKTSILKLKVGEEAKIGKIIIIAHKCWNASLDQKPESKILLEVSEEQEKESVKRIFYGWIFASSPSVSGLEHPIYDIIALSCKK